LFQKTDYLDVKIPSGEVVLPLEVNEVKNKKGILEKVEKNVLRVPIVFTPREMIKYQ
jgi:hydrocephalus-inducing protein